MALADRIGNVGAQRIRQADQSEQLKGELALRGGERGIAVFRPCNREHAHPASRHRVDVAAQFGERGFIEAAQLGDRFRSALGRNCVAGSVGALPDLGHGQQIRAQAILASEFPLRMQEASVGQQLLAQIVKRQVHRIERMALAGEDSRLEQLQELLGRRVFGTRNKGLAADGKLRDRHAVVSEGAGPVSAQRPAFRSWSNAG